MKQAISTSNAMGDARYALQQMRSSIAQTAEKRCTNSGSQSGQNSNAGNQNNQDNSNGNNENSEQGIPVKMARYGGEGQPTDQEQGSGKARVWQGQGNGQEQTSGQGQDNNGQSGSGIGTGTTSNRIDIRTGALRRWGEITHCSRSADR